MSSSFFKISFLRFSPSLILDSTNSSHARSIVCSKNICISSSSIRESCIINTSGNFDNEATVISFFRPSFSISLKHSRYSSARALLNFRLTFVLPISSYETKTSIFPLTAYFFSIFLRLFSNAQKLFDSFIAASKYL